MGEFELIRRFFQRAEGKGTARGAGGPAYRTGAGEAAGGGDAGAVALGIGDDCALLQPPRPGQLLAVSTDMLVEGRHFFAGADPAAIGHKSLAVNLSDLAAMGAQPVGFTLAIALPAVDEAWLAAFCDGMFSLADRFACPLIGGDTTRGPLTISITVLGQVPAAQALRRDGALPGDQVWVSGPLGGASFAVDARKQGAGPGALPDDAARRLDWPEPRLELGQRLLGVAHAAIDLSDGLAGDLRHVLAASSGSTELGAELFAADIPLHPCLSQLPATRALSHALSGGDDYELLFTADPQHHEAIRSLCPVARVIGHIRPGRGILLTGRDGVTVPVEETGFDHFSG